MRRIRLAEDLGMIVAAVLVEDPEAQRGHGLGALADDRLRMRTTVGREQQAASAFAKPPPASAYY